MGCIGGRFEVYKGSSSDNCTCKFQIIKILPNERVDAQWIIAKKDWEEEEKRQKNMTPAQKARQDVEDAQYHSGSDDDMRCILYIHGGRFLCERVAVDRLNCPQGGYYFGSVDQER